MVTRDFKLMTSKKSEDGTAPIYVRITKNRKSVYAKTGIRVLERHWNKNKSKVKSLAPNAGRFNHKLSRTLTRIDQIATDFDIKGISYSAKMVKESLTDEHADCFIHYYEDWVRMRHERGKLSYGTYKRYNAVISKIKEYAGGTLSFNAFTYDFLIKYESYLLNELSNNQNTVNSNFNCLRKAFNDAQRSGKVQASNNPFNRYKFKESNAERTYLTDSEMSEIRSLTGLTSRLAISSKNIFLLISETGIRIGDVLMLRKGDYDGERVHFVIGKTDQQTSILLTSRAKAIIERYWSGNPYHKHKFMFPVIKLSPDETDPIKIHNAISSATFKINRSLKRDIIPRTSITKHVSTHIARHTLATSALEKGLSFEEIRSILKHKDIRVTQQYAKITDRFSDQAIRKFDSK